MFRSVQHMIQTLPEGAHPLPQAQLNRRDALAVSRYERHLAEDQLVLGWQSLTRSYTDKNLPRPSASTISKISPELMDIIMSCSLGSDPTTPPSRGIKRNSDIFKWNLLSRSLSVEVARHIWLTVVIDSDQDISFVKNAIMDSGGRDGRIGSSIRMIYTNLRWTRQWQALVTLASCCSNLLRLDAPVYSLSSPNGPSLVSSSTFHRLKVLVLFGSRKNVAEAFSASDLAGLVALKDLVVGTRLELGADCPSPAFSLHSLVWQGKCQPEVVRWALQNSPALQVLMLRFPTLEFVEESLKQHGENLLSLRVLISSSIPTRDHSRLLGMIGACCPRLRELLWDICPEPRLFKLLPLTIKHIALNPTRDTHLFKGQTFMSWFQRLGVRFLTLWGHHACTLYLRSTDEIKTRQEMIDFQVRAITKWREGNFLNFALGLRKSTEWPFEDGLTKDYISPVFPDCRFR